MLRSSFSSAWRLATRPAFALSLLAASAIGWTILAPPRGASLLAGAQSGTPDGALTLAFWLRGLAAAGTVGSIVLLLTISRRSRAAWALALFCGVLWVYGRVTVPALDNRMDNELYVPASLSLLRDGDFDLSEFRDLHPLQHARYRMVRRDGRIYPNYPIGTPLLGAPVVAIGAWLTPGRSDPVERWYEIADFTADVFAALSVAVLFAIALELGAGMDLGIALSLIFAFATPHLPTHAGGLWSHNLSTLLLLSASWLAVAAAGRWGWLSALPLGLAFVTRPTSILLAPWLGLLLLVRRPRQVPAWTAVLVAILAAFVAWSHGTFGSWLPPYYLEHLGKGSTGGWLEATAGLLVSPNRGLLVFCPLFVFSLWGAWRAFRRRSPEDDLLLVAALFCASTWMLVASFEVWWGGGSYGPRLLAELFPFLTLLLFPVFSALPATGKRWRIAIVGALLVAGSWSAFAAIRGATVDATRSWNRWPRRITNHPERVWDWSDLQILRSTTGPPPDSDPQPPELAPEQPEQAPIEKP